MDKILGIICLVYAVFGIGFLIGGKSKTDKDILQGEWITDKNGDYICNQCRNYPLRNDNEELTLSNYCPNCGADMKRR